MPVGRGLHWRGGLSLWPVNFLHSRVHSQGVNNLAAVLSLDASWELESVVFVLLGPVGRYYSLGKFVLFKPAKWKNWVAFGSRGAEVLCCLLRKVTLALLKCVVLEFAKGCRGEAAILQSGLPGRLASGGC